MSICVSCGGAAETTWQSYRYDESGLGNLVLQGVEIHDCPACGEREVAIPRLARVHAAVARALVNSPARLTGAQLRFLREHLGISADELADYLETDGDRVARWESGSERIGAGADRLVRMVAAALDGELRAEAEAVARHLPMIADQSGDGFELQVDVETLRTAFVRVSRAA